MTKPCQGPDPKPRGPVFEVPAEAYDCHAHVFGPASRYPYFAGRAYTPPDASLVEYEHMLRTLGMERAVLIQPSVYGSDNTAHLDALDAATLEMRMVAVVDPDIAGQELERMHAAGVRGVRFNLHSGGAQPLEGLEPMAERIKPFGWHIQIFADISQLHDLAQKLGGLPVDVVIDHMGLMHPNKGMDNPGFQGLLRLLDSGRCWVKLSGAYRCSEEVVPYGDVAPIAMTLIERAPERMVWASDWPHPSFEAPMPNDGDLCDLLPVWAPEPELRHKILVENPAVLYGF